MKTVMTIAIVVAGLFAQADSNIYFVNGKEVPKVAATIALLKGQQAMKCQPIAMTEDLKMVNNKKAKLFNPADFK